MKLNKNIFKPDPAEETSSSRQLTRWLLVAIILVIAGGVLYVTALPVYQSIKVKRMLSTAEKAQESGNTAEAVLAAQTALLLDQNSLPALDILSQLAEENGSPAALEFRKRALELDSSNTDRALAVVKLLLQMNQGAEALDILKNAAPDTSESLEARNYQAAALLQTGRFDEAEIAVRNILQDFPDDPVSELNLVILLLREPTDDSASEINELLESLSEEPSMASRLNGLYANIARKNGDWDAALQFAETAADSPEASFADRLLVLQTLQSGGFDDRITSQVLTYLEEASAGNESPAPYLAWLIESGHAQLAVQWLVGNPQSITEDVATRIAKADALAAVSDWAALDAFTNQGEWPFADFVRQAYLARALREKGDLFIWQPRWREALREASQIQAFLRTLAEVTESWPGWENEHVEVLERLAIQFREPRALRVLASIYADRGDSENLLRVSRILHFLQPDDAVVANNFTMVALLIEKHTEEALSLAEKTYSEVPSDPARASTYAFALLKKGEPAKGLEIMEQLPGEFRDIPPIQFTLALLHHALGNDELAAAHAARARKLPMLDKQQEMLQFSASP